MGSVAFTRHRCQQRINPSRFESLSVHSYSYMWTVLDDSRLAGMDTTTINKFRPRCNIHVPSFVFEMSKGMFAKSSDGTRDYVILSISN